MSGPGSRPLRRRIGRSRWRWASALVVMVAFLTSVAAPWSAGSPLGTAPRARVQVAVVQSAAGGHVSIQRKSGKTGAIRAGERIYFGDIVLAGPGARAKFKVTVPKGFSTATDLLYIKPVDGAHPKLTLVRTGARTTEVTLSP